MNILIGALTVATLVASPAFAQPYHSHGLKPAVGWAARPNRNQRRARVSPARMQRHRGTIPGTTYGAIWRFISTARAWQSITRWNDGQPIGARVASGVAAR